jgi:undecaprenyl-diphosphatase
MMARARTWWRGLVAHVAARDRSQLAILLGGIALIVLVLSIDQLASAVLEGETERFDRQVLTSLRDPLDPSKPIGPAWLLSGALDITALGSATVLGLVVLSVAGFLVLQGRWRMGLVVVASTSGASLVNAALKAFFQRPRPTVVPHLREVMTMSFPSGHALTSAVVYLTLGALLMRIAKTRLAKFYCMAVAMLLTAIVGASRVYLGVHYPTDVLAGWLVGLSWALLWWIVERVLERRTSLRRERADAA